MRQHRAVAIAPLSNRSESEATVAELEQKIAALENSLTTANEQLRERAQELSQSKQADLNTIRLAAIVESSDDAIITKNLDGIITTWNKAAERIFGYTAAEALGKPVAMLIPADRQNEEPGILAKLRRGERIDHYETVRQRKDGRLLDVSLTVSPLRDRDGRIIGASKIARDVTELRKARDAVARSHQELEQRVTERTASLTRTVAQLEEFSYSVSHDLRSPIRAMQGYAQATLEDYGTLLDERGREFLGHIIRSGARMDRLVRDILTYSRIGRSEILLQPVSLDALVRDIISQYPEMQHPHVSITVHPRLGNVFAHEPSLTQAMSNLLSNAVKFVASGVRPQIQVYAEELHRTDATNGGSSVRLWIQDNGIGVKPEHQQRLFGLFQRIHPDEKYEGTGVGLAIVRKALERMVGRAGLESHGVGSKFWIELPRAEPPP